MHGVLSLRNCPSGGSRLPSARVKVAPTGGRGSLPDVVRALLTGDSEPHRRQVADHSALMRESRPSRRFRSSDPGAPHPREKILVGLTGLKSCRITFAIAIPATPDRRRGITLSCIILNEAVKVQPSTAGGCQVPTRGQRAADAPTPAAAANTTPGRRGAGAWAPRSRLDFDWGESKIAPDTA
jgi:hypothetical protein